MWYASLDGEAPCRACGRIARLDLVSRWMISCVLALSIPIVLLYGGLFYSGHLFVVSMFVMLGGWRVMSCVVFPFLSLEAVAHATPVNREQGIRIVAVLAIAAIVLDGYMSSRFDSDDTAPNDRSASAINADR
jgi:hypothetical protein